jgi:hypothetical protein
VVLSCLWSNLSDEDLGIAEHSSALLAAAALFSLAENGGAKVMKLIADSGGAAETQGSVLQVMHR